MTIDKYVIMYLLLQSRHHGSETRSGRILFFAGCLQGFSRTFGNSHHGHASRRTRGGLHNSTHGTLRTLANISELSIIYISTLENNKHGGLINYTIFGY